MKKSKTSLIVSNETLSKAICNPGALGSIETYINVVNNFPLITQEREIELAINLRDHGDIDAAKELVISHLRLVISIARQYLGYGLSHADLIQEGNIGLMKAVKRFDPTRGVRLMSFAVHWIKAEIHEFIIRNWKLVKIATTKAQRKIFFNLRSMKPDDHTLSPKQILNIAKSLNVKPEEISDMEVRFSGQDLSIDSKDDEDNYISYLSDNSRLEPSNIIEKMNIELLHGDKLKNALNELDSRSKRIIEERWLSENNKTLHDLANEFGISAERVRQIETSAMKKMKLLLTE
ncbi:RNA polymerase sigma factor RpoH [Candidatus Kinetoplastibacterium sorsogonicusi]|uniref:RNA polymerase sigma factor n=1 Tax=Candidatus Kinetoplastidibacterium kentomonadis TaxID=1576550 RepID=A0A3S7J932_9PROT|nr:RNA polymerase sigma factor RpoH [Candidatus Kinetoplastibacterium sorsogonicusi]AWD32180.1 RNA polymerase sigma factor RpoH [Candidatus Kinetoplastibacterium sorsogonicusi]